LDMESSPEDCDCTGGYPPGMKTTALVGDPDVCVVVGQSYGRFSGQFRRIIYRDG
jgi:hypothetical protein